MSAVDTAVAIGLVLGCALVAAGLKSRTIALSLSLLTLVLMLYLHPFFRYAWHPNPNPNPNPHALPATLLPVCVAWLGLG